MRSIFYFNVNVFVGAIAVNKWLSRIVVLSWALMVSGCMYPKAFQQSYYTDRGVVVGANYSEVKDTLKKNGFECNGSGKPNHQSCAKDASSLNPLVGCLQRVEIVVDNGKVSSVVPWDRAICVGF